MNSLRKVIILSTGKRVRGFYSTFPKKVQFSTSVISSSSSTTSEEASSNHPISSQEESYDEEDEAVDFTEEDEIEVQGSQFRLSKLIAETGYCSRRIAEKLIRERRVAVKGKIIRDPSHLMEAEDLKYVELDQVPLRRRYKLPPSSSSSSSSSKLSKEVEAIVTTQQKDYPFLYPRLWAVVKYRFESMNQREVLEKRRPMLISRLFEIFPRIFHPKNPLLRPVYRLTYKSEGLVLYTNNGECAKLFHSNQLNYPMTYRVRLHGKLTPEKLDALEHGKIHNAQGQKMVQFEDIYVTAKSNTNTWLTLTSFEKDVKKIENTLALLYLQCTRIICVGIGPYQLNEIFPAVYRANGSNQKKKKLANTKLERQRELQNQIKEIDLHPELHRLFLQFQNQKIGRGMMKSQRIPSTPLE